MKKVKYSIVVLFILLSVGIISAQNVIWTRTHNGSNNSEDYGSSIAVNSSGYIYVTGYESVTGEDDNIWIRIYDSNGNIIWTRSYNGAANGSDKGSGIVLDASDNFYVIGGSTVAGESINIWTRKYNAAGTVAWTRTHNGSGNSTDIASGIAVDTGGNVYVAGSEVGTVGGLNIWIRKYDSAGNTVWTRTNNGPANSSDYGRGIAVDSNSNVYVTGSEFVPVEGYNIWTRKYDSAGNTMWTRTHNGPANDNDEGRSIAVDASGNVYVTGNEVVAGEGINIWIRKYDSAGNTVWTRTYDGLINNSDYGRSIAVDSSSNVYVTGSVFVTGEGFNIWIRKYDPAGNIVWTRSHNGVSNQSDHGYGITVDSSSNVYVIGAEQITGEGHNIWVRKYSNTMLSPNYGPFYVATNGSDTNNGSFMNPFATIQKAVDVMSGGPPVCTSATCYIFPGIYSEEVVINSNKNSGYMVFTALSNNNLPELDGESLKEFGIKITNTSKVYISGLSISKYSNGIVIKGASTNNVISRNIICSNDLFGISFERAKVRYNTIISNEIFGANQDRGININFADKNMIKYNKIYKNSVEGIVILNTSTSNIILGNQIYSNNFYGISCGGILGIGNNIIISNDIYGPQQNNGITFYNTDRNIVRNNRIVNNNFCGIVLGWLASSNTVTGNQIFSNSTYGIYYPTGTVQDDTICSNIIAGPNQQMGIYISSCTNNNIYRNLIYKNSIYGIYVSDNGNAIRIINNTIYKSETGSGILFNNSSGTLYNNIILSNGDDGSDYGVKNIGTGMIYIAYNDIYGNYGGSTNGSLVWGNGNIFNDPMIETVTSFTISSIFSPAINSGTNIPGVTDITNGFGPDMGWKESSFISNIIPILPPEKPLNVIAYSISTNQIDIIWNNLLNETSYTLFRNTINNTNGVTNIANFSTNITNHNDIGLLPGTTYYYWVKAYNVSGSSEYSTVASNTTKSIEYNPFKGGKVKIGPTTIFNDEKLYFANVTRETKISIYDVKGRLLWSADVTDASKCIPQKEYLYIKPKVIEDLVDGLYIIVFKNNEDDPQIRKFNRITRARQ